MTKLDRIAVLLFVSAIIFTGASPATGSGGSNASVDKSTQASVADSSPDLLPDIIIRESDLLDHDIVTNIEFGHRHLRLSNGTPNIGDGPLYLRGLGNDLGGSGGTQPVNQRIYREDGTYWERTAGQFLYHPQHNHIHVEDWCTYRLREVLPENGVGPIVAEGAKTSFCILDLNVYNSSLPNFDPNGQFFSCGNAIQGLSVGWVDIYTKDLEGQNIDITNLPDGIYWLESEADPDNHFLEKDETNNITRIQIVIGNATSFIPDAYEPDNTFDSVDQRVLGAPNSPLLGPCDPVKVIQNLSIDQPGNEDIYKFYMPNTGTTNDSVMIQFQHSVGDLDLELYNANETRIGQSNGSTNREYINLAGRSKGWYYVKVLGYLNDINNNYTLVIDPSVNTPPYVNLTSQTSGVENVIRGFETVMASWTSGDAESNERWVTIWMNRQPMYDSNAEMIPTTLHTPADAGFLIVNTSYLDTGTYYVGISITDGGTTTWDWSTGTVYLWDAATLGEVRGTITDSKHLPMPDAEVSITDPLRVDSTSTDGIFRLTSLFPQTYDVHVSRNGYADTTITGVVIGPADTVDLVVSMKLACAHTPGDVNDNGGEPNIVDLNYFVAYLFLGGNPPPVMAAADVNASMDINVVDLNYMVAYFFLGGPALLCSSL